ncbi:MAG: hypothetical protein NTV51_11720 [Verrucomicrobia bacterium]|nr:hypothetical protein [Verrucomicrobiota bacterium]
MAYRTGDFSAAADSARHALKDDGPHVLATAWAILAMAEFRLNKPAEAAVALAKGHDLMKPEPGPPTADDVSPDFRGWIWAQTLLTEADHLLAGNSARP